MSKTQAKEQYETLLSSGDLLDIFPHLTGDWGKDKKQFTKDYNDYVRILEDMNVEYDEYDDYVEERFD